MRAVFLALTLAALPGTASAQGTWVSDTIDSEMGDGRFVRAWIDNAESDGERIRLTVTCHPTGKTQLFIEYVAHETISPDRYEGSIALTTIRVRFDSNPPVRGTALVEEGNTLSLAPTSITGFSMLTQRTFIRQLIRSRLMRVEFPVEGQGLVRARLEIPEGTRARIRTVWSACRKPLPT